MGQEFLDIQYRNWIRQVKKSPDPNPDSVKAPKMDTKA